VYARAYVFANGGGIGEILQSLGSKYEFPSVPTDAVAWDESKLKALESELRFAVI
jgi:hypothetical protein